MNLLDASKYLCSIYIGLGIGSYDNESACNAGDPDLIPGLEDSPAEGNGSPLQYSCLENSMDGPGPGCVIVHGVTKNRTRLELLIL